MSYKTKEEGLLLNITLSLVQKQMKNGFIKSQFKVGIYKVRLLTSHELDENPRIQILTKLEYQKSVETMTNQIKTWKGDVH